MDFLNNLDMLLKRNNISRHTLAKKLDIAPSTINSWFQRGSTNINVIVLKEIADFFDISIDELVRTPIDTSTGNTTRKDVNHSVFFTDNEFSKQELDLINNYAKFLKENRINNK